MAKAEAKSKPTAIDPAAFIAAVADPVQRGDAEVIAALMARLSGAPARMWGPSIVGFGCYTYRAASGHGGEMARIGFSPRKGKTVIYLLDGYADRADLLARLGTHSVGKSCLYIKRLRDVDIAVLEEMITDSLAWMAARYPPEPA